jgi:hypothetical protein
MAAPHRLAATVAVISMLMTALPQIADADTTPPAVVPPALPGFTTCGVTAPATSSAATSGTPSASTSGIPSRTTTGTTGGTTTVATTSATVPCIKANGDVFITYIVTITTTTTTTDISAPILAANGSISGVTVAGAPIASTTAPASTAATSTANAKHATTKTPAWTKCSASTKRTAAKAILVTCPRMPAGSAPKTSKRRVNVVCEPAPTRKKKPSARQAHKRTKSRPVTHVVVLCRGV